MTPPRRTIAVFGSSTATPDSAAWRLAHELGAELGRAGAAVMSGGYGGLMQAVSQGTAEAGGHVIGVTVEMFERRSSVNAYVGERVHTATLYERLSHLVERADGFVVLPGSVGTLTELFLVWTLIGVQARPPAPIVLLGGQWPGFLRVVDHPELVVAGLFRHVEVAEDAADAARRAMMQPPAAVPGAIAGSRG